MDLDAADIESIVGQEAHAAIPAGEPDRDAGGWLYDPATGAVVGHAGVGECFRIDSVESAEWALELRGRIEADIAALDARLEALKANLLALRAEQVRRLSWWEWRFGSQVVDFARRALAGGRKRTWTCPWGRVSFRKSKGRTEILDMDAAVEFVADTRPELVRVVKSVGVKDVEMALVWLGKHIDEEPERPGWLKCTGETESATIDTGIHIKTKGIEDNGE